MQIKQHFMLRHQRAQPVRDVIFELGRRVIGGKIAIEVAITNAALERVRHRVGDGHEGHGAIGDFQRAVFYLSDDATNAVHAREFVAVHGSENQDTFAGLDGGEGDGLEGQH